MSDKKRLAGVDYTAAQREWLKTEAARIGESQAAVQRSLIQEKIRKGK